MVYHVAGITWDSREPRPPGVYSRWPRPSSVHPDLVTSTTSEWHPEIEEQSAPRASPQNVLPPLSSSLNAHVVHDIAKVSITQLFQNSTNSAIQRGAYTFPLSAGCTVIEFSCRFSTNRIVRAKIGPKPAARQEFNDAVNRHQAAGLLEQDTSEIFTTTLGNIPANTRLKTEISFITVLKHKFANSHCTTTLTIPTYIAPRYGHPPTGFSHNATTETSSSFSAQVQVVAAEEIRTISSISHRITVDMGVGTNPSETWNEFATAAAVSAANRALVKLANGLSSLDRDFVLDIITQPDDGTEVPQAWLEAHHLFENHRALMLTIPPKFMFQNVTASHDAEIIFVADRSGSMTDKIQALKSAMSFFLRGIPSGRKFNIWSFGTNYTYLWPRPEVYSERSLRIALEYVSQNFISDMGGTELLPALEAIVRARGGMLMTDVIILTDGEVWRLDETIKFVHQTRRSTEGRTRFFALGVGNAVSHELVEGIAKAGGGYAEVISAAGEDGFEGRLLAMLRASLTGHVGPLRIDLEGIFDHEARDQAGEFREIESSNIHSSSSIPHETAQRTGGIDQLDRPIFLQSPADISTLSPFLRNRIYMLVDSVASPPHLPFIKIMTNTPDGNEIVTRVEVKPLDARGSTLHKLGARALLGDLERGQSWIQLEPNAPSRGSPEEEERVRREGEKLGCKWSLVSDWTSFYAVEELYETEGTAPDPFLDVDDAQIRQVDGNLGLLRPRRAFGPQLHGAAIADAAETTALLDERPSEGSDVDEEDDSESDPWEGNDGNVDGDDERRDESEDERGGASSGGNQGTGGGQDQQGSFEGGEPPAPDAGREGDGTFGGGNFEFSRSMSHFPSFSPTSSLTGPIENGISDVSDGASRITYGNPFLPQPPPPLSVLRHGSTSSGPSQLPGKNHKWSSKIYPEVDSSLLAKYGKLSERSKEEMPISQETPISAPHSNLPASTSLLRTERRDVLTAEEKDGEQVVRELLVFQLSDGSFQYRKLDGLDELGLLLGDSFASFVGSLIALKVAVKSAVTAAIVALLEEKFQFCQDLWVMMVAKAREYLLNSAVPSDFLTSVKKQIKTVEIRLKPSTNPDSTSYSSSPIPGATTATISSTLPTPSNLGTGNWSEGALYPPGASILLTLLEPTLSQSIARKDHRIGLGSLVEETQPTKTQPSHQASQTSATAGSPSQPLSTGLRGRRVVLDTAPFGDDDM